MNNKYAELNKKQNFRWQEKIAHCDVQPQHEMQFQNRQGDPQPEATGFAYAILPESESTVSLHDVHIEDKNDITITDDQIMNTSDVFTSDLNTNWTPTSDSGKLHQPPYRQKNYRPYHGFSNQIPTHFVEDLGSCVDGNRCTAIDCHCRYSQWSPFLSPMGVCSREQKGQLAEPAFDDRSNRRFAVVRRFMSPSSSESEPVSEEFEVIRWDSSAESDFQETCGNMVSKGGKTTLGDNKRESFSTAPNTPEQDLGHLGGWHTAPNTPAQEVDGFCLVNRHSHENSAIDENTNVSNDCRAVASDTQLGRYPNNPRRNSKQSVSESTLATFTKDLLAALPKSEADKDCISNSKADGKSQDKKKGGATESVPINKPLRYFDEQPIIFSADAVEYLVDSETGEAKTCGKGSFGQVYNARFSDPSLYHIPIVVKEFDEEFTSKKEILQEAQRLMFLQDTGYVPICYGMIELSTTNRRTYGIIQEFVGDGTTLEQILWERVKMPVCSWLTIALQCCDGLARFHDKGILLNDIKSNNIIIIFYGNGYVCIKYIDFGLATDMRGRSYRNTKSLEEFIYLAPEIRLGHARTNVASDIFSLGYMLDQIHHFADVKDLKFVASLCMNENPHCRIPVKAAVSVIEEQMEGLEFFNDTQSEWGASSVHVHRFFLSHRSIPIVGVTSTFPFWKPKKSLLVVACIYKPPHDKSSKIVCAPSEDSDQPGHPPSLIRVFTVRMKKPWFLSYPLSAQRWLWPDCANAQADQSPRWACSHLVGFVMRRLI